MSFAQRAIQNLPMAGQARPHCDRYPAPKPKGRRSGHGRGDAGPILFDFRQVQPTGVR
jgi:hypothetical protein